MLMQQKCVPPIQLLHQECRDEEARPVKAVCTVDADQL